MNKLPLSERNFEMKTNQFGKLDVILLVSVTSFVLCSLWLVDYLLPADAEALQQTVELASRSPEAKEKLALTLQKHPNPSRGELRQINGQVNELLVSQILSDATKGAVTDEPTRR